MWTPESLKSVIGRDDLALSGCGELVSEAGGAMDAALLDSGAYLAAGCAADHFLNPLAALAVQEINIEIPPIKRSRAHYGRSL